LLASRLARDLVRGPSNLFWGRHALIVTTVMELAIVCVSAWRVKLVKEFLVPIGVQLYNQGNRWPPSTEQGTNGIRLASTR
jgi:hypothetical protein